MKICYDCKFSILHGSPVLCKYYSATVVNPVSGETEFIEQVRCLDARRDPDMCGIEARNYIEKRPGNWRSLLAYIVLVAVFPIAIFVAAAWLAN